jgi:hypothetical protein
MITQYKIFENQTQADISDYVICEVNYNESILEDFINNNIGIILSEKSERNNISVFIKVKYDDVPENLLTFFYENVIELNKKTVTHFSKSKKELDIILNTKKFNL